MASQNYDFGSTKWEMSACVLDWYACYANCGPNFCATECDLELAGG